MLFHVLPGCVGRAVPVGRGRDFPVVWLRSAVPPSDAFPPMPFLSENLLSNLAIRPSYRLRACASMVAEAGSAV